MQSYPLVKEQKSSKTKSVLPCHFTISPKLARMRRPELKHASKDQNRIWDSKGKADGWRKDTNRKHQNPKSPRNGKLNLSHCTMHSTSKISFSERKKTFRFRPEVKDVEYADFYGETANYTQPPTVWNQLSKKGQWGLGTPPVTSWAREEQFCPFAKMVFGENDANDLVPGPLCCFRSRSRWLPLLPLLYPIKWLHLVRNFCQRGRNGKQGQSGHLAKAHRKRGQI